MGKSKFTLEQFLLAYNEDKTLEQIASELNVHISTICRWLKKLNMKKRRLYNNGDEHPAWRGYKEIPGKFLSNFRSGARTRGMEFRITIEFLWDLYIQQDRKCKYTGEELKFGSMSDPSSVTASIDRIDSSKGYLPENVQLIHKDVNLMKHILSEERFLYLCQQITNYQYN